MQNTANQSSVSPRVFKVGIVGASKEAREALGRIFSVTRYRTRSYQLVPLVANSRTVSADIDFVILCTNNPNVLQYWLSKKPDGAAVRRPLIRVSRRPPSESSESYTITVPINPGRLLKQLDHYTIKEFRYFPEFEIGRDSTEMCETTLTGLKLLRSDDGIKNKRQGLQRALVVDDSLAVRRQIEIEFNLLDAEVDSVASAEEAIAATQKTTYDIIFLDVIMPGMDGYAACKRIKRSQLNKATPVVLLTSRSSSFDKIKGALAGCDTYLVKPINHHDFEDVVNKYFSEARVIAR